MNLTEFRNNPAIKEDFGKVARPVREFLVQHLIETCLDQVPDAEIAQAQVGASKAIANIIKIFDSVRAEPSKRKTVGLKKLHRFSAENPEGEEPKTSAQ